MCAMICEINHICGGCPLRCLPEAQYRQQKLEQFDKLLGAVKQQNITRGQPVFITDGQRRRAELTFLRRKGQLFLGFNGAQSHDIADLQKCLALTPTLNTMLSDVRRLLADLCAVQSHKKVKNKVLTEQILQGEIWLTEAENGVDILLEIDNELNYEHRVIISEWMQNNTAAIRFSAGKKNSRPETILQKTPPFITIGGYQIFIPAGTFLQPSAAGEKALVDLVLKYIGSTTGNIADLFCGVGTFSYPLSKNIKNKITSADSSAELLTGFQKTVNAHSIPNIKIVQKNLFKYPFDATELKNFAAVVFDPPRAGAEAQVAQIAAMPHHDKPAKIVAVSCHPQTFINDANALIASGYVIKEITMVDQFVYTRHFELVALFEKGENNES